jgi:hypothetical protein
MVRRTADPGGISKARPSRCGRWWSYFLGPTMKTQSLHPPSHSSAGKRPCCTRRPGSRTWCHPGDLVLSCFTGETRASKHTRNNLRVRGAARLILFLPSYLAQLHEISLEGTGLDPLRGPREMRPVVLAEVFVCCLRLRVSLSWAGAERRPLFAPHLGYQQPRRQYRANLPPSDEAQA